MKAVLITQPPSGRASGRTFRSLLAAAYHLSAGSRVIVFSNTYKMVNRTADSFQDMFHHVSAFSRKGRTTFYCSQSEGRLSFRRPENLAGIKADVVIEDFFENLSSQEEAEYRMFLLRN